MPQMVRLCLEDKPVSSERNEMDVSVIKHRLSSQSISQNLMSVSCLDYSLGHHYLPSLIDSSDFFECSVEIG